MLVAPAPAQALLARKAHSDGGLAGGDTWAAAPNQFDVASLGKTRFPRPQSMRLKIRDNFVGILAASCLAVSLAGAERPDLVLADFEGPTYGEWKATGGAFGPGPAPGTLPGQMAVSGFKGQGLVNSFFGGDDTQGTLTSPPFTIERRFIGFLIGGGRNPDQLAFQLVVDGQVVRSATGPNDQPGGSEALAPASWDVSELIGKTGILRIVDEATGGWGHLNVDHIVQTDRRPPGLRANARREFRVKRRYLHLPIKNGAPKRVVTAWVDGRVVVRDDIELADGPPDWWAPMEVAAWRGQTLVLEVDRLPEDSTALSSIVPADTIKGARDLYREPLRGQFHFSPKRGWNNDPNGLAFFNGEYHLFFQHNPYGWGWGNMHWGHAVSRDLVHWRELGDKLLPDEFGPMFSGSAVVDWHNTSGLGRDGRPPLVLIYTAAGNPTVQCLASSTDGRNFTKYAGNPVLGQITAGNRDPKVIWHAPTKRWVMVLYVEWEKQHTIHFFTSPNLRDWTPASVTEGDPVGQPFLYECPDFFELAVDNDAANRRWVLTAANSEYAVGTFDGRRFTPEQSRLPGHRGRGFYAAQTFSDLPASDGRRIQIGWFQTETKGMPFNQSMTIPLELKLTATPDGPRMTFTPVRELEALRAKSHRLPSTTLAPGGANPLADVRAELVELRAEFVPGDAREVMFKVRGADITYDPARQELSVNGHRAPAPLLGGRQRLTIFCDRTGLEVFASDGLTYVPMPFQPKSADRSLGLSVKGGSARIEFLEVHELRSAWKRN
jgi:sucrose-6-phosphate hydrolase SacC (GH32 family)